MNNEIFPSPRSSSRYFTTKCVEVTMPVLPCIQILQICNFAIIRFSTITIIRTRFVVFKKSKIDMEFSYIVSHSQCCSQFSRFYKSRKKFRKKYHGQNPIGIMGFRGDWFSLVLIEFYINIEYWILNNEYWILWILECLMRRSILKIYT